MLRKSAVGLLETRGLLGAIASLDAALKTSSVRLASFSRVRGGRISFIIEGDIAAVQSAIDAAATMAETLRCLRGRHVIPSPDEQVGSMLRRHDVYELGVQLSTGAEVPPVREHRDGDEANDRSPRGVDGLRNLRTTVLRRMLRDCNDGRYDGRAISRMRKEELLGILAAMHGTKRP
jgi:microcompartment protein CcmL/EutN